MNRFSMQVLVVAFLTAALTSSAASLADDVKLDCPETCGWRFKVSKCTVEPGVEVEPVYDGPRAAAASTARLGIGNVMEKIRSGKEVSFACFGVSGTAADGGRRPLVERLRAACPGVAFRETHEKNPDLVFVALTSGDGGKQPKEIWRDLDGIVRRTWRNDPRTDIVFVDAMKASSAGMRGKGVMTVAASAMDQVADHYGIPSVRLDALADAWPSLAARPPVNHGARMAASFMTIP